MANTRVNQAQPTLISAQTAPSGHTLYHYQLSNGQNVFIEPRPSTKVASLRTFVQAGSAYENAVKPSTLYPDTGLPSGIFHLDEHCRFLTHKHYPEKNQLTETVESIGYTNAATSEEWVNYEITCNTSDLEKAIELHGEAVLNPEYQPKHLPQEQTTVINETRMRGNLIGNKVADQTYTMMFDRPVQQTSGTPEDVRRTRADHLQFLKDTFYIPSRMVTVVSGGVDPGQTAQLLENALGSNPNVPDRAGLRGTRYALPPGEIRQITVTEPQINYSILELGFKGPPSSDVKGRLIMAMVSEYLSSPISGVLTQRLVHDEKIATGVSVNHDAQLFTGLTTVDVEIPAGKEQQVLQSTLSILSNVAQNGIPKSSMEKIRNSMRYEFQRTLQKADAVNNIIGHEATHGNLQYYLKFEPTLNQITSDDIQQTVKKYLTLDSYTQVMFVPETPQKSTPGIPPSPQIASSLPTNLLNQPESTIAPTLVNQFYTLQPPTVPATKSFASPVADISTPQVSQPNPGQQHGTIRQYIG